MFVYATSQHVPETCTSRGEPSQWAVEKPWHFRVKLVVEMHCFFTELVEYQYIHFSNHGTDTEYLITLLHKNRHLHAHTTGICIGTFLTSTSRVVDLSIGTADTGVGIVASLFSLVYCSWSPTNFSCSCPSFRHQHKYCCTTGYNNWQRFTSFQYKKIMYS